MKSNFLHSVREIYIGQLKLVFWYGPISVTVTRSALKINSFLSKDKKMNDLFFPIKILKVTVDNSRLKNAGVTNHNQ